MRKINSKKIEALVEKLIYEANFVLPKKVRTKINQLANKETNKLSKTALNQAQKNWKIAEKEELPLCQDTGLAIFFIEIGNEILLSEPIEKIINRATKKAYKKIYLRKSTVVDPLFERKNKGDNLPAFIHLEQIKGDKIKIKFLPKGGGAENKSRLKMLVPADGEQGIIDFVADTAKKAGGSACPPFVLGIGIGGSFDSVGTLAKKAISRDLGTKNKNKKYAQLEKKILKEVNKLKIGAMGYGGKESVLGVHIKQAPCHIASMPVAVNIQCHSARSAKGQI